MLAYCATRSDTDEKSDAAMRMAASLGLFAGRPAATERLGEAALMSVPRAAKPATSTTLPEGGRVLVVGEIDEARGALPPWSAGDLHANRYAAAFQQWGEHADASIVGDYAALIAWPDGRVRLARSPWRAPPLHVVHDAARTLVASVPRALIAAGLPSRLDRERLARNLYFDLTGDEGWYEGTSRVARGEVLWLFPDGTRRSDRWYDHLAPRHTETASRAEAVEEVDALLTRACALALDAGSRPGVLLSGGLDSSNVASRCLDVLPAGRTLKSFTFRPHADFRDIPGSGYFYDDWPLVERFAEDHPRLEPHWARAEGFDEDWDRLLLAMGIAPAGLPNMALYTPLLRKAKAEHCDLLLDADMGNLTFSANGKWAYPEYFLRGRWGALAKLFAGSSVPPRDYPREFARRIVSPFLPDALFAKIQRRRGKDARALNRMASLLAPEASAQYRAEEAARHAGAEIARDFHRNSAAVLRDALGRGEMDTGDIVQGYEQVYGMRWRDVTSYRPLVEFCLGLPTDMFAHDGKTRWLARELGKGRLPEAQRTNHRYGFHNCDWHARLTPRLAEIEAELDAGEQMPELRGLIDFAEARAILRDWPAQGSVDDAAMLRFGMALPRAVQTIRLARFAHGHNR